MRIFTTLFSFLLVASLVTAQKTISGKVTDSSNEALIGVNILEVGTSNGTVSDLEGNYRVNVSSDEAILEFTYAGYEAQRKETKGLSTIDLVLEEGLELEEIVVTALGISREKKGLTFAVDEVSSDELTTVKDANV
ncbi:MAG: ferric enterobactin receptor, partial [Saprospiraceae bacterium]